MKRSIFILLAASALAALSCTKEVNDQTAPEKEMVTMSFDATLAAPTKVELGTSTDDGYKVMWSAGDAISVFADDPTKTSGYTNGTKFTTDITAPNATATFTGETEVVEDYYAAIPYNSVHRWYYAEEYFSLDFYTVQTADGLNNGLAFAKAENGSLQFEHVTGYIKFTIPETYTDIKQVSVKGNDNETIGGNYVSVYLDGTTEVLANHVALELILVPEGEVFEPGVYYIAAVPAEINSGLTITFTNTDNEVAKKTSSTALEIKAGDILNLGTVANLNFEAQNIPAVTVEDFLDLEESSTKYQLTGIISNIVNTQYGNFDLTDATGTVYVYGLTATPVASNDKSFSSLGLKEGDEVTLVGTRSSHNGEPQVGGPAYYVSHKACVAAPVVSCEENTVTITAETGATVYYTTDESDPVTSNTRQTYSTPFEIDETTVVKAYAVVDGKPQSVVVSETCVVINSDAETVTLTVSMTDYATTHDCTISAGSDVTNYKVLQLDQIITMTAIGEATNEGSFWSGIEWRLYQTDNGGVTVSAAEGYTIQSVKFTYSVKNNGTLKKGDDAISSDIVDAVNASSVTYTVGNTATKTNGQVKITEVEVVYCAN